MLTLSAYGQRENLPCCQRSSLKKLEQLVFSTTQQCIASWEAILFEVLQWLEQEDKKALSRFIWTGDVGTKLQKSLRRALISTKRSDPWLLFCPLDMWHLLGYAQWTACIVWLGKLRWQCNLIYFTSRAKSMSSILIRVRTGTSTFPVCDYRLELL